MNTTDLDALAISRLASVGQRYTTCRRRIMHILTGTSDPMTIPLILASAGFGGLAQSSVYRNLAVLERVGLVQQIPGHHGGHAYFTLGQAATTSTGDAFLRCTRCTTITSRTLPAATLEAVAGAAPGQVVTISVDQVCPTCATTEAAAS